MGGSPEEREGSIWLYFALLQRCLMLAVPSWAEVILNTMQIHDYHQCSWCLVLVEVGREKNLLMISILPLSPFLCLRFVLSEEMKEPDDHDTDEGKSDRSQSSARQSLGSSQTVSRCK